MVTSPLGEVGVECSGTFSTFRLTVHTPSLSIVIVAFRSRSEITACVGSIPRALLIGDKSCTVDGVVIDNSLNADGTADLLAARDSHLRCEIPAANLGFGRANNLGYSRTRSDVVLFLNPDTVVNTEALAHCMARLEGDPSIGLISPKLVQTDGSMDLACRRRVPSLWDGFCRATGLAARYPQSRRFAGYNLTYLDPAGTYDVGAINGAFMMGRRDVFEEVGLFDEDFFMYGDDLDLCYRFTQAGYRVVYDGRVSITHLKGTSVAKDYDRMSKAIFDANKAFYLKHFNPRNSRLVRLKFDLAFGAWKRVACLRARLSGSRTVRPV